MIRFWFFIWLVILFLQAFTCWTIWQRGEAAGVFDNELPEDLLALASETNRQWAKLGGISISVPRVNEPLSGDDRLVQRESLILQLRDAEVTLVQRGSDIRIVSDLQDWLGQAGADADLYPVHQYISNLVSWLTPFGNQSVTCALQRLALYPDASSPFPSLSFELAGDPSAMGQSLLDLQEGMVEWRLNELDVLRMEEDRQWWMRGSLSFASANGAP